ncbi:MAG: hypothetical protein KGM99_16845, partial [Burkholderiales bacterium]|nr:hypothetical protein [Burkholderiales bacterium]
MEIAMVRIRLNKTYGRVRSAAIRKSKIIFACTLQDMITRFGGSYAGYLIAIAWPLCHLFGILLSYTFFHRAIPVGDDPAIFAGTGLLPYIICLYPARVMALTLVQNKPLLQFTIVSPLDIIAARIILETVNAICVTVLFFFIIYIFGSDVIPLNLYESFYAVLATIFLGIGMGVNNIIIVSMFGVGGLIAFIICMIGLYITSG